MKLSHILKGRFFMNVEDLSIVLLALALMSWVLFVATPFDIIASNADEFLFVSGWQMLSIGIACSAVFLFLAAALYILLCSCLGRFFGKLYLLLVVFASIFLWANSTFMVGVYGEIDGRENLKLEEGGVLSWVQLSALALVLFFAFLFRYNSKLLRGSVSFVLCVSVVVSSVSVFNKLSSKEIGSVDSERFFTYSKNNNNLIFILLDEYQTDYFRAIVDDELKSKLDGFIWFEDAAANFPTTIAAMPAMMTGEVYSNDEPILEFFGAVKGGSFFNVMKEKGGVVSYTDSPPYMFPDGTLISSDEEFKSYYLKVYADLLNISVFRAVPDIIKSYVYDGKHGLFDWVGNDPDMLQSYEIGTPIQSYAGLKYISEKDIVVKDDYPFTARFHHSVVTHSPTTRNEQCLPRGIVPSTLENKSLEGLCAIDKVLGVVDKIKRAGVFDNTMIIVSADHGSGYAPSSAWDGIPYNKAASTLLIKPIDARGPLVVSDYPAQLSDIPKTVSESLGLNHYYPGVDILSDEKPLQRVRFFNNYTWSEEYHDWSKDRVPPITRYEITGALNRPESWKTTGSSMFHDFAAGVLEAIDCDSHIRFDNPDIGVYGLSAVEPWGRWSDGSEVKLQFRIGDSCDADQVSIDLTAFLTAGNKKQAARLLINQVEIADLSMEFGDTLPANFVFDLPDAEDRLYTMTFKVDTPVSPSALGISSDIRQLGLGFRSMKIISKRPEND